MGERVHIAVKEHLTARRPLMIEKTIRIRLVGYKNSNLLMAVSDDLRGLVVHGRSQQEIAPKLEGAVRELLEAEGFRVLRLTVATEHESPVAEIGPPTFIANASLTGQAQHRVA